MDAEARAELKKKIVEEIEVQKHLIESFTLTSKPVAPDNAIGRLTRMEAISSQGISEASLNSAQVKLVKLEKALSKVDLPDPEEPMMPTIWPRSTLRLMSLSTSRVP